MTYKSILIGRDVIMCTNSEPTYETSSVVIYTAMPNTSIVLYKLNSIATLVLAL